MSVLRPTILVVAGSRGRNHRWSALAAGAASFAVGLGAAVLLYLAGRYGGPLTALVAGVGLVLGARAIYLRMRPDPAPLPPQPSPPPAPSSREQPPKPRQERPAELPRRPGVIDAEPIAPPPRISPPGPDLEVATVVHSAAELDAMLNDKPPCWRYAAFVSVLVQRRAAVRSRLLDARTGFARPGGEVLPSGLLAGLFFTERLEELSQFVNRIDDFMTSDAFRETFGGMFDEASADAAGIVQTANRLMDYHDGLLSLSERCRSVSVPAECRSLQRDFGLLTVLPLEGFATFIDDFTDRVAEMGDVARFATGNVVLDPVELGVRDGTGLLAKVSAQLRQLMNT